MAYSAKEDLLVGDIRLSGRYGDGSSFVQLAADEIDGQIGHIYKTPIEFVDPERPEDRPAKLLLKKINNLLASGRIILDQAAGGEDRTLHAYGASMWAEAIGLLNKIQSREILLQGAEELGDVADDANTAVSITQADSHSLVEGFYRRYAYGPHTIAQPYPLGPSPMRPYDVES